MNKSTDIAIMNRSAKNTATAHMQDHCGQLLNAQGLSFLPGGSLLRDPANPSGLHMPVPGFVF